MAVGTTLAALVLDGLICLALLALVAVILPAAVARQLREVVQLSLLLALPLAVSVVLVNVLFTPAGTFLVVEVGPLRVTREGMALAATVVARIVTMAGAIVLFSRTTRPSSLVASLQAHGLSPRMTFIIHNGVAMIPRLAERAGEVTAAQRARGMDTEASPMRRARGVAAVAVPTVLGAMAEVETRTLALETRAFTRPGPRALLRVPRDTRWQRLARWVLVAGVALLAVTRMLGVDLPC